MVAQSLSALLAAVVTLAIGFSVVLREVRTRPQARFAVLCFNLGSWQIASFLYHTWQAPLLQWLASLFAVGVPLLAVRFFRSFLADDPHAIPHSPRPLVVAAAALVAAHAVLLFARPPAVLQWFGYVVLAYVFGGLGLMLWLIDHRRRTIASRVAKTRLLYVLVGAAASVALSFVVFVPGLSGGATVAGNVFVVIYIYFLSQTLSRYRLLDLNEVLGKIVVLSVDVLLLTAVYLLLLAWVRPHQHGVFFFNTLVASFIVLVLFDPLRHYIEQTINRWLFRQRYELGQRLDELRRELASIIDIRETVRRVLFRLEETHRVTNASVYLLDADGSGLDLAGCYGPRPVARLDAVLRRPFLDRLRREGVVSAEGVERDRSERAAAGREDEDEGLAQVAETLEELQAGVCIAVMGGDVLTGIICLRDERLREAYSSAEIKLLRAVAAQAAITIQNSKLYERMKERDRLAAVGEMAAGLAHEIRNPLGAIKAAAQFLGTAGAPVASGPGGPPPGEFLRVIVEETNRLNNVVSQFLDYARPYRGDQQLLDLNEVVRRTLDLLPRGTDGAPLTITPELGRGLPRVRADAEQLRQVFLNLGLNAVQAMGAQGGVLTVTSRVREGAPRGQAPAFVEVSFSDTGPGIAAADLERIFIPFYTTKEKGTGLGLSICQRIIENHGGAIEVRSPPGAGARFSVVLPVEADAQLEARAAAEP
jgi:signal transduction histidine kinase